MPGKQGFAYASEIAQPTDDQIAHWRVLPPQRDQHLILIGNCPSCHDRCETSFPESVVQGGTPAAASAPKVLDRALLIVCACLADHKQPPGHAGCGRYWLGRPTAQQDGSYRMTVEQNLGLLPAAAAVNAAVASQDERIQRAAEKWLAAVTGIYGLFSLTGVATAKDALSGLGTGSKWLVAIALLMGVTAASLALFFGYRAAYGWPRMVSLGDDAALTRWYADYRGHARSAARHLQAAVVLAFGSLGAVTIVMLLTWFLPRHKA